MYTPPGTPRSRSFTRFTMRVGLEHLGQSVLLVVSITFLRSAVLAILATVETPDQVCGSCFWRLADHSTRRADVPRAFAVIHLVCAGRTRMGGGTRFRYFT